MRKIKLANDDDILKHLDNLSLPELSKTRGGKDAPVAPVYDPPIMYTGFKVGIPI